MEGWDWGWRDYIRERPPWKIWHLIREGKKKKKKPKDHLVLRWTWINTRTLHPWICQRSVISTKLCLLTFLTRIQSIKAHTRSIESFLCKIHFLTNIYIVLGLLGHYPLPVGWGSKSNPYKYCFSIFLYQNFKTVSDKKIYH